MNDFNLNSLVRKNVLGLKPYASARDEFKDFEADMVFLDANENPFNNGVNRYPDPQQTDLKEVLAKSNHVEKRQILLGNGSDEVLDLIYRVFCEPNVDNIISLPPTYGMYQVLAQTNAIENREVLLREDFQPDIAAIKMAIDSQTKLIFICSPNNPTGNSIVGDKIEELLLNFNGIVVIDEAYIDFSNKSSWLERLEEFPNLIITHTLSKAYGLAGIRLGICYASKAIITLLNKIKPPYNVNSLSQVRALEKVLDPSAVANEISKILAEKKTLTQAFHTFKFIEKVYPSDANFILVQVDNANKRYRELIKKGVVVRNRNTQPLCENTLRFTVGTPVENKKLIQILKDL